MAGAGWTKSGPGDPLLVDAEFADSAKTFKAIIKMLTLNACSDAHPD